MVYQLIDHYDVWGDMDGGWHVNDSHAEGHIDIPALTDAAIMQALINYGYLIDTCKLEDLDFGGDDKYITINDSSGCPLCSLSYVYDQRDDSDSEVVWGNDV